MASKCQDSGTQVLYPVNRLTGTVYCGCCGQTVNVVIRPGDSNQIPHYADHDMAKLISTESPEYMAGLTTTQLRTLATSKRPEHLVAGFAAECELVLRGEK
jgi:uncharacterized Zn finger protein (UPF0148 family)